MRDSLIATTGSAAMQLQLRTLADQIFSRTAGAPLIGGNAVRVLKDAGENYPAWLAAIETAQRHVHFENYIVHDDSIGGLFADALLAAARRGVQVRVIYDWLGCLGAASARYWDRLRAGGVEVRCYNPPRLASPLGWITRDHRKMVAVDGRIGFVTGLCVGEMWVGDPKKNREPWRDTGVEIRGPGVADVERAFGAQWASLGPPIPSVDGFELDAVPPEGDVLIRVVDTVPATAGMLRLDQLVASLARKRVWLTDAYYAGTATHVQSLVAAARAGVDVRLLVPNTSDIPILKPVSRSGYRTLLEAGVRVFEWNGTMLHAKTAVVDGRWARIGSSNLNLASWLTNCELDVAIENAGVAQEMEQLYLQDLDYATEVVLEGKRQRHPSPSQRPEPPSLGSKGGRSGPAAAGAIRVGRTLGAAIANRRVLAPAESRLMAGAGLLLLVLAALFAWWPRLLAYPLVFLLAWIALSLLYGAWKLHRDQALDARSRKSADGPRLGSD